MKNKKLKVLFGLVLTLALILAFTATAWAAAGDPPAHAKYVAQNPDGTYTIALDVTGESEKTITKVNVVVVLDSSGSMDENTGNTEVTYTPTNSTGGNYYQNNLYGLIDGEYVLLSRRGGQNNRTFWYNNGTTQYTGQRYTRQLENQTRMEAAQDAVNELASALLSHNGGENDDDTVEMVLIDFDTNATTYGVRTTAASFAGDVARASAAGGTNWEAALAAAKAVNFGTNDNDTTYIIFVSDGNPTYRLTLGSPTYINGTFYYGYNGQSDQQLDTRNYSSDSVYGSGYEQADNFGNTNHATQNVSRCYDAAKTVANTITGDDDYVFYTIGVYGNVDRMEGLGGAGYYSAENTAALQEALAEILEAIELAGIGSVEMTDGTTSNVKVNSSDSEGLLTVDATSFKYYRAFGENPDGEGYKYDPTENTLKVDNETTIQLGEEWTGEDVPEAELNNGSVVWDLGEGFILENGVKYTVTFDCWPSQTTLDLIADIKNDPTAYGKLPADVKKYFNSEGNLKTNTGASMTYTDTRPGGGDGSTEFNDPEAVSTQAVEQMAVSKAWVNTLDDDFDVDSQPDVKLDVKRDTETPYTVTVGKDNDWADSVYISIGIMTTSTDADGNEVVTIKSPGHDFTFSEPDGMHWTWELDIPTVRPMMIDGVLKMLYKVDEKHQAPEGAKVHVIDGKQYYEGEITTAELTATNYRRSSVNLVKKVEGTGFDPNTTFPFTLNIVNSLAPESAPSETDDPNHDSDWWVWISVRDMSKTDDPEQAPPVTDAVVSGATHTSGGWYYGVSGQNIVLNVKDGYSIRLNSLPSGSTYTITEGNLPSGFFFKSAEIDVIDGSGDDPEKFSGGKDSIGEIEAPDTVYQVTYTNEYEKTQVDVEKVWVDSNNAFGTRPDSVTVQLYADGAAVSGKTLTLSADATDAAKDWKGSFTDLDKYKEVQGQDGATTKELIVYTVDEPTVPTGYAKTVSGGTITNTLTTGKLEISKTINGLPTDAVPEGLKFIVKDAEGTKVTELAYADLSNQTKNPIELPVGTYAVSEEGTDYPNYTLDAGKSTVSASPEVKKDETAKAELKNEYTQDTGSLTIKKTFAGLPEGTVPTDLKFKVTGPNNYSNEVTYSAEAFANGYKIENLPVGEYTVTESGGTVENYTLAEDTVKEKKATVAKGVNVDAEFTNTYEEAGDGGTLTIIKTVDGPADLPATTKFTITGPEDFKKEISIGDFEKNDKGEYVYTYPAAADEDAESGDDEPLAPGEYTVTENKSSAMVDGYTLHILGDNGVPRKVDENGYTFRIRNRYADPSDKYVPEELNGEDHYAYMIGYPDGLVHPERNITRAEVATIFFRLLTDEAREANLSTVNSFGDVEDGMWFNVSVSTMANMGIVNGYPDGDFHPNDNITRAEFAAIAARFDKEAKDSANIFTDIDGHWAKSYILRAVNRGWINGYPDSTFRPDRLATRAEVAAMVNRVLVRDPEDPDDLLPDMIKWPDNMDTRAWYYLDIQEATNTHEYERQTKPTEVWMQLLENPDWTKYQY